MAKISIKAGSTSKLLDVFIQDSSSTTGAGLGSLVYNSSGLTAYYYREGAATSTAITLATMTLGTWATGGFVVIDGTNMLGCYQLSIPDAAIAAGAKSCIVYIKGVTNMAPLVLEIELTAIDNQDTVRFGMTALPNAAAEAAGGLFTRGTGAGQINQDANGRVNVNAVAWNALATVELPLVPTTAGRKLDVSAGGEAGLDWANIGSPTTIVALTRTSIDPLQKVDVDTIKTNPVVNAGTVTFPTGATLASTTNITAGTIATVTNLTNAPTAGDLTATMKTSVQTAADAAVTANTLINAMAGYIDTEVAAIKAKTDNLPASPAAVGSAMTLTSAYDFAKGTVAMTEGYAVDGSTATPSEMLYMLWALMAEKSIAATTLTAKKLDGTTSAMTFTLSDATSPVSITRAT